MEPRMDFTPELSSWNLCQSILLGTRFHFIRSICIKSIQNTPTCRIGSDLLIDEDSAVIGSTWLLIRLMQLGTRSKWWEFAN